MGNASTITSKGQTTIPKSIRDRLNLRAGDRLEFIVEDDGRVVLVPATVSIKDLKGMLPAPKKPVTLEAMDAAIETSVAHRFRQGA